MTTMQDLVADTRRMTYGSMADQLNFLNAEYLEGDGELTFLMDVTSITPGMVLSSGLNVWYVTGVDAVSKKATVYASYDNSHNDSLPVGSPVMIRPRVTDWLLFTYLNDTFKAISSPQHGLYRQGSWDEPNTDVVWGTYAIPVEAQNMTDLIRIQARYLMTPDLWTDIPLAYVDWQPENQIVRVKGSLPMGTPLRFDYKAPFLPATALTDDLEVDCGLPESMHDIPALGASARLLRTTESRRSQIHNQSDPRRAAEVQSGANSASAADMAREFRQRIADEQARLVVRNPYMRSWP